MTGLNLMANKVRGGYQCGYCKKFFTNPVDADNCKEGHDLIYIPLSKEDLNRLIMFLYSKEDKLLTSSLVETLQKYQKGGFSLDLIEKVK